MLARVVSLILLSLQRSQRPGHGCECASPMAPTSCDSLVTLGSLHCSSLYIIVHELLMHGLSWHSLRSWISGLGSEFSASFLATWLSKPSTKHWLPGSNEGAHRDAFGGVNLMQLGQGAWCRVGCPLHWHCRSSGFVRLMSG